MLGRGVARGDGRMRRGRSGDSCSAAAGGVQPAAGRAQGAAAAAGSPTPQPPLPRPRPTPRPPQPVPPPSHAEQVATGAKPAVCSSTCDETFEACKEVRRALTRARAQHARPAPCPSPPLSPFSPPPGTDCLCPIPAPVFHTPETQTLPPPTPFSAALTPNPLAPGTMPNGSGCTALPASLNAQQCSQLAHPARTPWAAHPRRITSPSLRPPAASRRAAPRPAARSCAACSRSTRAAAASTARRRVGCGVARGWGELRGLGAGGEAATKGAGAELASRCLLRRQAAAGLQRSGRCAAARPWACRELPSVQSSPLCCRPGAQQHPLPPSLQAWQLQTARPALTGPLTLRWPHACAPRATQRARRASGSGMQNSSCAAAAAAAAEAAAAEGRASTYASRAPC